MSTESIAMLSVLTYQPVRSGNAGSGQFCVLLTRPHKRSSRTPSFRRRHSSSRRFDATGEAPNTVPSSAPIPARVQRPGNDRRFVVADGIGNLIPTSDLSSRHITICPYIPDPPLSSGVEEVDVVGAVISEEVPYLVTTCPPGNRVFLLS
jgi:hypothetical protein